MTSGAHPRLEVGLLGPFEIRVDGEPAEQPGGREGRLLAWLAAEHGSRVSIDHLTEGLWPTDPPRNPAANIQAYVSRLRKRFGKEAIRSVGDGYALDARQSGTDAVRFEELAEMAHSALRSGQQEYGAQLAREALDLWRGTALQDFRYEDWAAPTIRRLEETRLSVLEDRLDAELAGEASGQLVVELEGLVEEHPTRERFRGLLMLALYRAGRQAEALAAYQDARRYLGEELGIEPSPELQDLEEKILLQHSALLPRRRSPAAHNLEMPLTSFIARDAERSAVEAGLLRSRLVTVLGPPGAGKSRLALETALGQLENLRDGVWHLEVGTGDDPARLEQRLVECFADTADLAALAWKQMLVVLDGAERSAGQSAEFVRTLLGTCPAARVLATSRQVLQLSGEEVVPVGPLPIDDAGSPAVALLMERAAVATGGTPLDPEAALEVVRRLDGIPLAIELVAARLRHLDESELRKRLAEPLTLAEGTARDRTERHESVRAAIASTYDTLDAIDQVVLQRLTVFPASFHLDAAEHIVPGDRLDRADVLPALTRLADTSLLAIVRTAAGQLRYDLLGLIRRFAEEQARADDPSLRRRFVDYHTDVARRLEPRLTSERDGHASAWIDADADNMRAALGWALQTNRTDDVLVLASVLARAWVNGDRWASGRHWLSRTLAGSGGPATAVLDARLASLLEVSGQDEMLARLMELVENG